MKLRLFTIATVLMASTTLAHAAWDRDEIVNQYQSEGYTRIEIVILPTYAKVEAIRGNEKLEVIYDLVTGNVLDTEQERVEQDDETAPGVFVRERDNGRDDDDGQWDDDRWDDDHDRDDNDDDDRDDDDDDRDDNDDDNDDDDDDGREED